MHYSDLPTETRELRRREEGGAVEQKGGENGEER